MGGEKTVCEGVSKSETQKRLLSLDLVRWLFGDGHRRNHYEDVRVAHVTLRMSAACDSSRNVGRMPVEKEKPP